MLKTSYLRRLVILGVMTTLLAASSHTGISAGATTTFILLRHADRAGENLSQKGKARAEMLPAALKGRSIDAIYSPDLTRNLDTAAPLAKVLGLSVKTITPYRIVQRISAALPTGTVVWVGNKDNLKKIWKDLKAAGSPPLTYGDLFIVEQGAAGTPKVTRLHFGP